MKIINLAYITQVSIKTFTFAILVICSNMDILSEPFKRRPESKYSSKQHFLGTIYFIGKYNRALDFNSFILNSF